MSDCKCISTVESKLAAQIALQNNIEQNTVQSEFTLRGFGPSEEHGIVSLICLPFKVTAPITGYRRGKIIPVTANYCPVCGTKLMKAS